MWDTEDKETVTVSCGGSDKEVDKENLVTEIKSIAKENGLKKFTIDCELEDGSDLDNASKEDVQENIDDIVSVSLSGYNEPKV